MGKKVIIISSSPRKDGNSDTLAKSFASGAEKAGNDVTIVNLCEKNLGYCKGWTENTMSSTTIMSPERKSFQRSIGNTARNMPGPELMND